MDIATILAWGICLFGAIAGLGFLRLSRREQFAMDGRKRGTRILLGIFFLALAGVYALIGLHFVFEIPDFPTLLLRPVLFGLSLAGSVYAYIER